ncbi:unnamed protein product [Tetraodon nigroviridis]|uniref:Chromosome 4 SCAF15093, whole genome shotgun sequence n=1 Tax=Tetraodon nigroviridis TaxID=99883 RepID=Q4RGS5_TETNG|nr:unnamed protein product [Tetraodon nigroviridis]
MPGEEGKISPRKDGKKKSWGITKEVTSQRGKGQRIRCEGTPAEGNH